MGNNKTQERRGKSMVSHQSKPAPANDRTEIRWLRQLPLIMTGGLIMAAAIVGAGFWRTGDRFFQNLQTLFTMPQPEPQVDIRSIVVQQVRGVSELTTAIFSMEAIVPASRDRTLGNYVIGKTTLLYIAYGEVRAGVDLSKLQPEDVQVSTVSGTAPSESGSTIHLRLPPPQILDSKIDVNRSHVYDYDRGFLGLGPDAAPELQDLAQRETLAKVMQTACAEGVLDQANQRADLVVTQLLSTAGYKDFSVETQSPNSTACGSQSASAEVEQPQVNQLKVNTDINTTSP
jgi:Protein of unknown function (DUF4230)